MFLSHMDKDHPKNESRWSVYIHSGQFWPVWRNQIFPSIQKKVKIEWKSIYVFICTQTEAVKPTGVTDNENPSLSHFHSSSATKEEWRQTVTDRQRNCQSKRPTKRVKSERLREKENKILPTVNSDRSELRKREGGGMGRGRGREKKMRTWLLSG